MALATPPTKKVVILEDNAPLTPIVAIALTHMGWEVSTESCPGKAVRRVLDHHFDLLLTDYRMPGLDGYQVAHLLRTMGSMIPVILHTAEPMEFDTDDLRLMGILGVIRKPLGLREFQASFLKLYRLHEN